MWRSWYGNRGRFDALLLVRQILVLVAIETIADVARMRVQFNPRDVCVDILGQYQDLGLKPRGVR